MRPRPKIKTPFPYCGNKSPVVAEVWSAFGQVRNYIEPFFGSGAMLLGRPGTVDGSETINDLNGFISNFWRAVQADPQALAGAIDWPTNEVDMEARHRFLIKQPDKDNFTKRLRHEPKFYDIERAAWWCWGACLWFGNGWCDGDYFGPDDDRNKKITKMPTPAKSGILRPDQDLEEYFQVLSDRLRGVVVCCGDWSRVVSDFQIKSYGQTAVFLDPPYSAEDRSAVYQEEDFGVAHEVRDWCLEHGGNPLWRLALCGYAGEGHEELLDHGWREFRWRASGGYANQGEETAGKANRIRERIWFSPHCRQRAGFFKI
jgi:DNA adenine methylase